MARRIPGYSGGHALVSTFDQFTFAKSLEGRAFTVGTGLLTSAGVGQYFKWYLRNPYTPNSTRTIYLFRMRGLGDDNVAQFAEVRVNPTTGIPTTPLRNPGCTIVGSGIVAAAEFRAEAHETPFGGGGVSTNVLAIPDGQRWELEFFPLILRPGTSLAFSLPSGGNNRQFTCSLYFVEDEAAP